MLILVHAMTHTRTHARAHTHSDCFKHTLPDVLLNKYLHIHAWHESKDNEIGKMVNKHLSIIYESCVCKF